MKKKRPSDHRPSVARSKGGKAAAGRKWMVAWLGPLALAALAAVWAWTRPRPTSLPGPNGPAQPTPAAGALTSAPPAQAGPVAESVHAPRPRDTMRGVAANPRGKPVTLLWEGVPSEARAARLEPPLESNVRRVDYAGAEACADCHRNKYDAWSSHAHRWMNALATPQTVKGDFSGVTISYLGGVCTFYQEEGGYRMKLARDGIARVFEVTRTLGSRFFQYYIGRLREGPDPATDDLRRLEHVLPIGYWINAREWVPIVHVESERPDGQRADPFVTPSEDPYDEHCSICHTTRPLGDWMLSRAGSERLTLHSPHSVAFEAPAYLAENHPDLWPFQGPKPDSNQIVQAKAAIDRLPALSHAVNLGISCEACHNGARQHAAASRSKAASLLPLFFVASPYAHTSGPNPDHVWSKQPHNSNWICARCHTGGRPTFANGIATWNSTEFSDAELGFCFGTRRKPGETVPSLTCVHCHDPHTTIGQKWKPTPAEDDAKCTTCHKQFVDPSAAFRHTRHKEGTAGSHCMDCHMPRINEGLEDAVRTHTIFNPTDLAMIQANQPNACNLCHLDKSIEWTLRYFRHWYGLRVASSTPGQMFAQYPDPKGPAGLGWLKSPHEPTRLVAIDALTKAKASWALPALIEALDDPYLLNRQFAYKGLQEMLNVRLADFGYRFYMTPEERRAPLERLRVELPRRAPPAN